MTDLSPHVDISDPASPLRDVSNMAAKLIGSEILRVAWDVRARIDAGQDILNLTVGDFAPGQFPVPAALNRRIAAALSEGRTNYPPPGGIPELRSSIAELYRSRLGISYPERCITVTSGARPAIAATYLALVNPGDLVVYGAPSWNNNHYCTMTGATPCAIEAEAKDDFFLTVDSIAPHLRSARLLCLNSPQNPTGTMIRADHLRHILKAVVDENARRARSGQPALYLLWDQIYWMLRVGEADHVHPAKLVPESAAYTIYIDGISKAFAATGLRVGWAAGPSDVIQKMTALSTHVGAWAPKPEQHATAEFLANAGEVDTALKTMTSSIRSRLEAVHQAFESIDPRAFRASAVSPEGAIYLSILLELKGRTGPSGALETDEDIRQFILNEAGVALLPFRFFGVTRDTGWFRASVGAVSQEQCASIEERLKRAVSRLQ